MTYKARELVVAADLLFITLVYRIIPVYISTLRV